ncbi:SDR family oxidoreductase [bacterium SCSIO 12741]|nr:SDR family oxidoreductase [bacterium SCSIO 12741]
MKLKNKVAVITGGNSGIGLSTAQLFAQEGAKVIITGRRKEALDQAVAGLGENAEGIVSDASSLSDIKSLYETVKGKHEKIDVLFLNAGIGIFEPLGTITEEAYDKQFNINVKGLLFNVQEALPLLNPGASVVVTSSVVDQKGFPTTAVYSATKAAVRSFIRTLAAELAEKGIRVNSIAPGPIETPFMENSDISDESVAGFVSMVPLQRLGQPEEIAKSALYLASEDSSYVTGIDLVVDGGMVSV